jgi:hypothetical protein
MIEALESQIIPGQEALRVPDRPAGAPKLSMKFTVARVETVWLPSAKLYRA